jgi:CheY-like chemotaxis protein
MAAVEFTRFSSGILATGARIESAPGVTSDTMPRTLLVVDDNRSVRESLKFLLLRRGYGVLVAENGPEAIAIAAQHVVDGALVDVNMPGMNGIEVCRLLREQTAAAGRQIAVWMMTGARTPEVVHLAREAGALELLGKPFDLHALYRRFEEQFARGGDKAPEVGARPSGG